MKHKVKHIHFVGIGGAGMSGIAEVFLNLGYRVSGSDLVDSPVIQRLRELNATVFVGHESSQIKGADAVVTSTAVKSDNPEIIEAKNKNIPVVPRALMLAIGSSWDGPNICNRWEIGSSELSCQIRKRRIHRGRSGRIRCIVSLSPTGTRRGNEYRCRPYGYLWT